VQSFDADVPDIDYFGAKAPFAGHGDRPPSSHQMIGNMVRIYWLRGSLFFQYVSLHYVYLCNYIALCIYWYYIYICTYNLTISVAWKAHPRNRKWVMIPQSNRLRTVGAIFDSRKLSSTYDSWVVHHQLEPLEWWWGAGTYKLGYWLLMCTLIFLRR